MRPWLGISLLSLCSLLAGSVSYGGQQDAGAKQQSTAEERAKWPLPPDLVHFKDAGCHIYTMVKESALDAKTGKLVPIAFVQIVQPTAGYDDNRENWVYAFKDGKIKVIAEFPDTDDGLYKAVTVCQEWRKFVKLAAASAKAEAAHKDARGITVGTPFSLLPAEWTALYYRLNYAFFGGKLPYAVIRSSPIATDIGSLAYTFWDDSDNAHIVMSDYHITCLDEAIIYLAHEMVHVELHQVDKEKGFDHGDEFQKEMVRLAISGAFKDSW